MRAIGGTELSAGRGRLSGRTQRGRGRRGGQGTFLRSIFVIVQHDFQLACFQETFFAAKHHRGHFILRDNARRTKRIRGTDGIHAIEGSKRFQELNILFRRDETGGILRHTFPNEHITKFPYKSLLSSKGTAETVEFRRTAVTTDHTKKHHPHQHTEYHIHGKQNRQNLIAHIFWEKAFQEVAEHSCAIRGKDAEERQAARRTEAAGAVRTEVHQTDFGGYYGAQKKSPAAFSVENTN